MASNGDRVPEDGEVGSLRRALRQLESELAATRVALEEKTLELARALAAQKESEAELREQRDWRDADRRKDEFLATLAHELRNPLAPIRQAALISKAPGATEEQKRWTHDVIDRQVQHMSLLLDDLLDISRVTRGTLALRMQLTELATVVETAVGKFEGILGDPADKPAVGKEVTVSIRPECWTLGREARGQNSVAGRIGESIYLGEVGQYAFVSGGTTLKIFELNPRFVGNDARGELFASVDPEDVVILTA